VHAEVVEALRCPIEGGRLTLDGRTLRCADGHAFDLARQGYVNLLGGRDPGTGDDAAMVAARDEVLAAGRFGPLTATLADVVARHLPPAGIVVDLGAGTGHHLAGVLDRVAERVGIAIDLSKHAARRAARAHPRVGAVVADVWQGLPVATASAGAVLCVFAPRNALEIARVLRPDGVLVVATPTPDHLAELVDPLGLLAVDPHKEQRLLTPLAEVGLRPGRTALTQVRWQLEHAAVRALVAMGPSADHLGPEVLDDRVRALTEPVTVTVSVEVRAFTRQPG
jgi:23S rRNA (guanine745-N1)-methyltransferase